jgi:lysozyme
LARKKKYKGLAWVYGAVICSALAFAVYIVFLIQGSQEVKAVEYKAFGIPIPPNYQIHGIDVSRYQERISWEAVKEMNVEGLRIGFAFIKAKDGTTQVKNFLKLVKLEPGDLPPVLDVESSYGLSASKFRKQVKKWLQAMETAYGVKPIIYTYVSFYQRYLSGYFDEYPMWVAHYFQLERPRISRSWAFWQHNDQGRVNGILSKVDFNVFNGDSAAFRALLVP